MKKILFNYCLTLISLVGISQEVLAVCTLNPATAANYTAPLQAQNITVGRDVPLGGVIYQQFVQVNNAAAGLTMRCPTGTVQRHLRIVAKPLPLSKWNTGRYAGKVYETDVPGIGVAIVNQGRIFPFEGDSWVQSGSDFYGTVYTLSNYEIYLIKISDTVGSGVIRGNRLPSFDMGYSHGGSNTVYITGGFSGFMNVVSRTCQTPNVDVPMGELKLEQAKNDNAPWINFIITLKNCPAFYGTRGGGWPETPSNDTTKSPANYLGIMQSNTIRVNLKGTIPPINANLGILALNPVSSGPVASGIGIQITDSYNAPIRLAPGNSLDSEISTREEEGRTYTIPLSARYRQTSNVIKPGKANATAEFTIIYP